MMRETLDLPGDNVCTGGLSPFLRASDPSVLSITEFSPCAAQAGHNGGFLDQRGDTLSPAFAHEGGRTWDFQAGVMLNDGPERLETARHGSEHHR